MIKKLLFLSLLCSDIPAATHYDRAQLVKQVFGATGANLSLVSFQFMEDLFHRIATSTPYEQRCACKKAAAALTQEIEKRETSLTTIDAETKEHIQHNLAILTIQKDHYERVARLLKKEISITQKIIGRLKNATARFLSFLLSHFKKYTPPIQKLTNDLVMYTEIERNEILTDHKKTLRLLVCQNKYNIPLIIRFWDYPRHRHRLLNGVKKFQGSAQPQALAVISEALETVGNVISEQIADVGETIGAVIGDSGATDTLVAIGKAGIAATKDVLEATAESLAKGAAEAGPIIVEIVAKGLESVVDVVPDVLDSEITLGEAASVIVAATETATETATEVVADVVATQVVAQGAQVTAEETAEAATHQAAETAAQTGQNATTTASTEATAGTGDQVINTFGMSTNSVKYLQGIVKQAEAAAISAKEAAEVAAQAAEQAAAVATKASEATAKIASEASDAHESFIQNWSNFLKKKEALDTAKTELDTAKAEAATAKAELDTAKAEAKAAKADSEADPKNTVLAQKASVAKQKSFIAEQKFQEASKTARIKSGFANEKGKEFGEAKKNTAKAKEEAVTAKAKSDELAVNLQTARESEQLAAENATQASASAKAAENALAGAEAAVMSARIALYNALTTQVAEQAAEQEAEETGEAAEGAGKKLTKAEKKALEAAKKTAQKEAVAAAKVAAKNAKEAAKAAKAATKAAAKAAKAEQKAFQNVEVAQENLAKARAAARLDRSEENLAAIREAQESLDAETQELQVAKETTTTTKEAAATARAKADEAKAAAKAAAEKAFGPVKTWVEHGKEFATMMGDLVLQMEIAMGAQMVAAWQSAADALVFASLSQQRTMLMTNLNHFFSQLAVQQTNALAQINANFSAQIAVIASQLCLQTTSTGTVVMSGLLPTLFAVEQSFVTQALVKATVKSIFLLNPMPDDQLFYESPMAAQKLIFSHTPFKSNGLSNSWYNPYRSGNWQFCSTDYSGTMQNPVTSFVQYNAEPFITSNYPQGDPTFAVQNSIFTEYIPPAQYNVQSIESYTISVAITLLSEPYEPFMIGIMFNGARWISGVLDLHHQHRLFCIYSLPGQKTGTYNVGFAETFYQNQGQMNQTQDQLSDQNIAGLNAIWPAYQILSPNINALSALAKSNAATPINNPIATIQALPIGTPYIFTIETQPNQVTLTISTLDGKILYPAGETASSLKTELSLPNQIQNLNGLTFLYHNIGFTAPGCSAQFCVKKPTALCFSESQIKTIQASLDKGTS